LDTAFYEPDEMPVANKNTEGIYTVIQSNVLLDCGSAQSYQSGYHQLQP